MPSAGDPPIAASPRVPQDAPAAPTPGAAPRADPAGPAGAFLATPDGYLLEADPGFAAMLGYDPPQALLDRDPDVLRGAVPSWFRVVGRLRNSGGRGVACDLVLVPMALGRPVWIHADLAEVPGPDGGLAMVRGAVRTGAGGPEGDPTLRAAAETVATTAAGHRFRRDDELARALVDAAARAGLGVTISVAGEQGLRLAYANAAAGDMLRTPARDLVGGPPVPALDPAAEAALRRAAAGSGGVPRGVVRNGTPDGRILEVSMATASYQGRPAVYMFFHDVTERQHSEDAAARWRSTLEATLESTADGILVVDREGHITHHNHGFARMWRLPREVLARGEDDRAIAEVLDQLKDPEGFQRKIRELYADPVGESFDVLEFRDGRVFERYSRPLTVAGANQGRVWSFRDVTDRRRIEAEVRRERARWRSLVENALGYVATIDRGHRVTFTNRIPPGLRREDVVGRPATSWVPSDAGPLLTAALERVFATGEPETLELPADLPAGRTWFQISLGPLRDGREVTEVVGYAADITDLKRAEEERVAAAARAQEVERLRAMDAFRAQFLNNAAHELGTPLTPLRIHLELLKGDRGEGLSPEQRRSVEVLDRNLRRLQRLVEDLLESARLQSGSLRVAPQPVDVSAALLEAVETLQPLAARAGIRLEARAAPGLQARADAARLAQVLVNLLSNAVKFTPRGGQVEASAAAAGGEVVVRVSDTGAGLDPDQLSRLFRPFTQVHDPTQGVPGTGLGLYVSKGIVELHGGRIWAESPGPGKGATFAFTLPAAGPGGTAPGSPAPRG